MAGLSLAWWVALAAAAPPPGPELREAVRSWRRGHEAAIVRELAELLALPNLASDASGIRRNAEHLARMLERRGLRARLLDGRGGPPVVFGELSVPGARRTVVLYAHYDGQPVDPAQWSSPPWSPVLRTGPVEAGGQPVPLETLGSGPLGPEWRLYARSAGDDKAPVVAMLAALDALAAAGRAPSVSLKVFLEGEEEAGSPHLAEVLAAHADLLRADGWLLCDGPVHQSRRMQLFYGARGVTDLELTMYGPLRPLHSGHYGNWAPNPAVRLAHLLASLRDGEGRILVAGFYDDVRPASESERAALERAPAADELLREAFALAETEGGAPLLQRLMLPALNVRGLESGRVGERAANAIPAQATASIDFRLVPDQTPAKVRERVERHLRALGYAIVHEEPGAELRRRTPRLVRLRWGHGYPPARTALDLPFSRAVAAAVEEAAGAPLILLPTLGGSIPMHLFAEATGSPIVGLPIANHDNNQHAADENLRLQNLWDAIEVFATLFARLEAHWPPAAAPAPRRQAP